MDTKEIAKFEMPGGAENTIALIEENYGGGVLP